MIHPLKNYPQFQDQIGDLIYDLWDHKIPDYGRRESREWVGSLLSREDPPLMVVAVENDRLIGMGSLMRDGMEDRLDWQVLWMGTIYVDPAHRGRGVASRIVTVLEDMAREGESRWIYLYTEDQQHLYRRLGWKDYEDTVYLGERVTVMIRDLLKF